jgi:hypothetical protein
MSKTTYTPLATVTLGTAVSQITFASIPATYRDVIVVIDGALSGGDVQAQLNADTGSNYSTVIMRANATVNSQTHSGGSMQLFLGSTTSGARLNVISQFMDYSATDKHKTALSRSGYKSSTGVDTVEATASRWANTAAVNSIKIISGGNFQIGTTMSLYGIVG